MAGRGWQIAGGRWSHEPYGLSRSLEFAEPRSPGIFIRRGPDASGWPIPLKMKTQLIDKAVTAGEVPKHNSVWRQRKARHAEQRYTLAERLEALFLKVLLRFIGKCSFRTVSALGGLVGYLVWILAPSRRRISLQGLSIAFDEQCSREDRIGIARSAASNFVKARFEFLKLACAAPSELRKRTTVEGMEHLVEAVSRQQGVLLFTVHLGCWDLIGERLVAEGFPITVVSRPRGNPLVEELWKTVECQTGVEVLSKFKSMWAIMRSLRRGRVVGILPDQHAGRVGVFVKLFGRPTSMHPVVSLVALRTGAPVIPCMAPRGPDGRVHIRFFPPLSLVRSDDPRRDVRENTELMARTFESFIREYPDQYLWMHYRWRKGDLEQSRKLNEVTSGELSDDQ